MHLRALAFGLILASVTYSPAYAQDRPCNSFNQEFNLYLESNTVGLTSSAMAVVEQALENMATGSDHCRLKQVTIIAHTDRQGSAQKNLYLSQAIAENLKDELSNIGINRNLIVTVGRGEDAPAKPTADNKSSPLNRRAEVKMIMTER